MQLAVSFVVACFLASAYSNVVSQRDFQQQTGTQWKYLYETQVLTGIPTLKHQYTGLAMKFEVLVEKLRELNKYQLRILPRIKTAEINQKYYHGPGLNKRIEPHNYREDSSMDTIRVPITFIQKNGVVTEVFVNDLQEKNWALNVKKAILALLSRNNTLIREDQQKQQAQNGRYTTAKSIYEKGTEGNCTTVYQVFPEGQGPITRPQLHKIRQQQQQVLQQGRPLLQVTKIRNLDQCNRRDMVLESQPSVVYCKNCGSGIQEKWGESNKLQYLLDPTNRELKKTIAESESIVHHMGKHNAAVSAIQELTLLRVNQDARFEVEQPQNGYKRVPETRYDLPTGVNRFLYQYEEGQEQVEIQSLREDFPAEAQDIFLQQRALWGSVFTFSDNERNTIKEKVKQAIKQLSSDIVSEKTPESKPTTSVGIWMLAKSVSQLKTDQLLSLYNQLSTDQNSVTEQRQIERKLFLDALVMAGSTASIKVFRELIESRKIQPTEATELATGLQETVSIPITKSVDQLLLLCNSQVVKTHPFLHSAACLSTAEVIHKTCKADDHLQMSNRTMLNRLCRQQNLKRVIDTLAQQLELESSSSHEKRAVYLQTLANTGTVYALEHVKKYVVNQRQPTLLRTSILMSLKPLAYHYPQLVQEIVLPIYNNRQEQEIVRIAAASIVFASRPTYAVLEKMAVDLSRETDNQVGSFVYTTLHTLANTTIPSLRGLATNATKAAKLATPFRLDRITSYRKLVTLWDVTKHVNIMTDVQYVSNKRTGLPKLFSSKLFTTSPGNIVDKIFESRALFAGIEQKILDLVMPSQASLEQLPPYFKSIIERLRLRSQPTEQKEGEAYVKLFDRTLYAYISENEAENYYQRFVATARNIQEKLRNNVTTTYVKTMLPQRSGFAMPNQVGLVTSYFQSTEIVIAVRLQQLRLRIQPPLNFNKQDLQIKREVELFGTVKPFVRVTNVHVIGVYNAGHMKFYSTGQLNQVIANAPSKIQLRLKKQEQDQQKYNFTISYQPQIANTFAKHDSYAYTGVAEGWTMTPCYAESGISQIRINANPIKVDKEVGKEQFGMGLRVTLESDNPWSLHTMPWMKKMENPVQELPGTLLKLAMNPWLAKRQLIVRLEQGQQPTSKIETTIRQLRQSEIPNVFGQMLQNRQQQEQQNEQQQQQVQFEQQEQQQQLEQFEQQQEQQQFSTNSEAFRKQGLEVRVRFDGYRQREWKTHVYIRKEHYAFKIKEEVQLTTTVKKSQEPERQLVTITARDDVQTENKSRVKRILKIQTPTSSMTFEGVIHRKNESIDSLPQPEKSLATELKKRCIVKKQQLNRQQKQTRMSQTLQQQLDEHLSPECVQAINNNKAVIREVKYEIDQFNMEKALNLTRSPMAYVQYLLYPYLRLQQERVTGFNKKYLTFRTMQGLDLTTVVLKTRQGTWNFSNVHHESRLINKLLELPTDVEPLRKMRLPYFVPSKGVCKVTKSHITTFDGVFYPFESENCEYILAQDRSEAQQFTIVTKQEQNGQKLKVLVETTTIEVDPPSSSYWSQSQTPVVKVNGQRVQLSSQENLYSSDVSQGQRHQVYLRYKSHDLYRQRQVVEINVPSLGLRIETDGSTHELQVPRLSRGMVEGLCGNNNGEQTSEYMGPNECEYEQEREFIKTYQVPTQECPAPVVQDPVICYRQQEQQEQREEQNEQRGPNIIMRNKVMFLDNGKICFSTRPQRKCRTGFEPQDYETREVQYHCIDSETSKAKELEREVLTQPIELRKTVHEKRLQQVPVSCKKSF